jgi:hypothetical protein
MHNKLVYIRFTFNVIFFISNHGIYLDMFINQINSPSTAFVNQFAIRGVTVHIYRVPTGAWQTIGFSVLLI